MSKLRNMRIIEIKPFRAVSSGEQTLDALFGNGSAFGAWLRAHERLLLPSVLEPNDLLWHEDMDIARSVWIHPLKDGVAAAETAPWPLIDFPGGMYLVATADERDSADLEETICGMHDWIRQSGAFEYGGFPMSGMCNMPDPDGAADAALGIAQQQIFLPIMLRRER